MRVSGHITFSESELELGLVRKALKRHIEETRAEPGCVFFEVTEDPYFPGRFGVLEEFVSKEAFYFHQRRTQKSEWSEISKNGVRSYTVEET
ncbi:MAG: antibiotic biosynthesis monooxygenase [Verrucomicrobiota bacterium]